ncbi:MAG: response regulator [Acidaminococcales bacterium]|nr:response regulator [Acidaminococcales bacterium]
MAKKILILEDDLPSLNLLKEILTHYGYNVLEATDGLQAIKLAEEEKPHLAIVDIMLPTLNGYQVCERLRSIPSLKNMPIMVLTVLNEDLHRIRAIEAGATDFLIKPFDRVELVTKIKALLSIQEEFSHCENFDDIIFCLSTALEHRDPAIPAKCRRVAYLSEQLALRLELPVNEIAEMKKGVYLQDIGLLAMSSDISPKALARTEDAHAALGSKMFAHFDRPIAQAIILHHHRNLKCGDYPHDLPENIRALINIVSICNRFEHLYYDEAVRPLTKVLSLMEEESRQGFWHKDIFCKFKKMAATGAFSSGE